MSDYLIYACERLEKLYPKKSWDELMNYMTTTDPANIPYELSIEYYANYIL